MDGPLQWSNFDSAAQLVAGTVEVPVVVVVQVVDGDRRGPAAIDVADDASVANLPTPGR
jgi:hypothetical protein